MNQQDMFDGMIAEGRRLAREGMGRALLATPNEWRTRYRAITSTYIANLPAGTVFSGEQLTDAALRAGLPDPHAPTCWGANANAVLRDWFRLGGIAASGCTMSARKPQSHARRYPCYIRCGNL